MSGFKLLAIRPLEGCDTKFSKVLELNKIYQFYNEYKFNKESETDKLKVTSIEYDPILPNDLYKNGVDDCGFSINISAVVGKNGAGKSSLLELFFLSIYNLAVDKDVLRISLKNKDIQNLKRVDNLFVEIYYCLDENIYCLKIENGYKSNFRIIEYNDARSRRIFIINDILENSLEMFRTFFFYSIAINYSFYGLNSKEIGDWIKALFHKNDGYQTPIVINPFRKDGNIDINREIYLAKQRLLSNILIPVIAGNDSHLYLIEDKKVKTISLKLNKSKTEYVYAKGHLKILFKNFFEVNTQELLFQKIHEVFFDNIPYSLNVKFREEVEKYILKKIVKIARTYPDYEDYFTDDLIEHTGIAGSTENSAIEHENNFYGYESFEKLLRKLKEDESHVTFKLRQAINYLKNNLLDDGEDGSKWEEEEDDDGNKYEKIVLTAKQLSDRVNKHVDDKSKIIEFIPPSIFDIEIKLEKKVDNIKNETLSIVREELFSSLSSGEQQFIHTIQGILYHIYNVHSVYGGHSIANNQKITYTYINLILDEIELYFHPDYQRKFISNLIKSLKTLKIPLIEGVNILFSTHSPFILSDIPSANILKLHHNTNDVYDSKEQTFAANIHDLLANDFFMDDGFMGKWAVKKINDFIEFLEAKKEEYNLSSERGVNYLKDKKYSRDFIDIIGEPLLKESLLEIYYQTFVSTNEEIDSEIERLNGMKK